MGEHPTMSVEKFMFTNLETGKEVVFSGISDLDITTTDLEINWQDCDYTRYIGGLNETCTLGLSVNVDALVLMRALLKCQGDTRYRPVTWERKSRWPYRTRWLAAKREMQKMKKRRAPCLQSQQKSFQTSSKH